MEIAIIGMLFVAVFFAGGYMAWVKKNKLSVVSFVWRKKRFKLYGLSDECMQSTIDAMNAHEKKRKQKVQKKQNLSDKEFDELSKLRVRYVSYYYDPPGIHYATKTALVERLAIYGIYGGNNIVGGLYDLNKSFSVRTAIRLHLKIVYKELNGDSQTSYDVLDILDDKKHGEEMHKMATHQFILQVLDVHIGLNNLFSWRKTHIKATDFEDELLTPKKIVRMARDVLEGKLKPILAKRSEQQKYSDDRHLLGLGG